MYLQYSHAIFHRLISYSSIRCSLLHPFVACYAPMFISRERRFVHMYVYSSHAALSHTCSVLDLSFVPQDICRTAHRFFLSQRCVYVVCLDLTRCDELSRIAFWLSSVRWAISILYSRFFFFILPLNRSFNRDATILLVGTHADKVH